MTVSGLTMTSVVRHPVQMRESPTQSHRSVFASRTRRGRVRCITCSWCRKASTSAFGARTRRCSERQEGTRRAPIEWLESVSIVARNINYCKKNGVFTRHRSVRAGVTTTRAEKRRMSVGTAPLGLPLPGLSPARSGGLTTNSRPTGSTIRQALMSAKSSVALAFIVLSFSSGL
jgi:hypothetical protein